MDRPAHNLVPPALGPARPLYPEHRQLVRVGARVGQVYEAALQQWDASGALKDRAPCYAWEPNGLPLTGYQRGRLVGSHLGLPLVAVSTACCQPSSFVSSSVSPAPSSAAPSSVRPSSVAPSPAASSVVVSPSSVPSASPSSVSPSSVSSAASPSALRSRESALSSPSAESPSSRVSSPSSPSSSFGPSALSSSPSSSPSSASSSSVSSSSSGVALVSVDCCPQPLPVVLNVTAILKTGTCVCVPDSFQIFFESPNFWRSALLCGLSTVRVTCAGNDVTGWQGADDFPLADLFQLNLALSSCDPFQLWFDCTLTNLCSGTVTLIVTL